MGSPWDKLVEEGQGQILLMDELAQSMRAARNGLMLQWAPLGRMAAVGEPPAQQTELWAGPSFHPGDHLTWKEMWPKVRLSMGSWTVASALPV